jgi:hypothetical protein
MSKTLFGVLLGTLLWPECPCSRRERIQNAHHEDRTHLGLEKETPNGRIRSVALGRILSQKRIGGLHHRYDRAA